MSGISCHLFKLTHFVAFPCQPRDIVPPPVPSLRGPEHTVKSVERKCPTLFLSVEATTAKRPYLVSLLTITMPGQHEADAKSDI